MAAHRHPAETEHPAPSKAAFPAGGAGSARPKAERPGRHAEPQRAARRHPAETERPAPSKAARPAGGAGSALPRAEPTDHHAERLMAMRRPAARAAGARYAEPSARPADVVVSGGRPGAGRVPAPYSGQVGAPQGLHAARRGARAADARLAARRVAAAPAWREAAPGVRSERMAPAVGAGPVAERAPPGQRDVPGHAGRAVRRADAAGAAAARADHPCLRRREPGRPGIRPRRRPARLAKGPGPAGRSRPATSVSCAFLFPSFVSTCGYQAASGLNPR